MATNTVQKNPVSETLRDLLRSEANATRQISLLGTDIGSFAESTPSGVGPLPGIEAVKAGIPRAAEIVKDILRAGPRAAGEFTLSATGEKEFVPGTGVFPKIEKFLFGEKPIKDVKTTGEETVKEFGGSEELAQRIGPTVGFGLGLLDIIPGFPGKKKAAVEAAEFAVKFAKSADFIKSTEKFLSKFPVEARPTLEKIIKTESEKIFTQRRGILNDADIANLAKGETGILDKLIEAKPGTILPAEQSLAARQELADRILQALTPETALKEADVLPQLLGTRAETGRALRSFVQEVKGGPEAARKLLDFADQATDPIQRQALQDLAKLVSGTEKIPDLMDKIVEWATAIRLTSPLTQFRNIGGNTFSALLKFPEKFFTSGVDKIRSVITGKAQERFASEVIADFIGTSGGLKEGALNAVRSLADENFAAEVARTGEFAPKLGGAIQGTFGKVVRLPFRLLNAVDNFFRTANQNGALYGAATRRALQEGLSGEKLVKKINELVNAPDETLVNLAQVEAKRLVFQEDLTGTIARIDSIRQNSPWIKLIVPFFRTPVNIFKSIIQRTPLTFTLPSTLKTLKVGGGEASEVVGRMLVGSTFISGLTMFALEGKISGSGPDNKAERDALLRQGWQPFSIKVNNNWISYRGLEPLSGYLSLAADIAEVGKEPSDQSVLGALGAIASDFLDQPFLTGASDLIEALMEPEKKASRFFANFLAGSTIPTGVSYISRLVDPTIRKPISFLQTLESRIPFLSKQLLPVRGAFGEEARREGGLAQRLFPASITTERIDLVEQELNSINKTIGFPSKSAFGEKLSDEEYDTLLRVSGKITKEILFDIIQSEAYQSANISEKDKIINKVVDRVRKKVRERAFKEKFLLGEIKSRLKKRGYGEEQVENIASEVLTKMLRGDN